MGRREDWERRDRDAEANPLPPSRFLEEIAPRLPRGRALDVACGAGRHALLLARLGFTVDAIDRAWAALRPLHERAATAGLSIHPIQADLESFPLPRERYDVVVDVRYLQRGLLPALKRAVRPGGGVVFETFLVAQRALGHPTNPAYLLEPGELRAAFGDFDIVVYTEGYVESESGPAYLARLLARRPLGWQAD
jgi:SAM-dependent methyltransferase